MRDETALMKISDIIYRTLSDEFHSVKFLDVKVRDDLDFDGDEILRVDVVIDASNKDIESGILASAVRHIRPKLFEIDERAFPILSFITSKDLKANGGRLAPA